MNHADRVNSPWAEKVHREAPFITVVMLEVVRPAIFWLGAILVSSMLKATANVN